MRLMLSLAIVVLPFVLFSFLSMDTAPMRILVFTKTTSYRHSSIKDGINMFVRLGKQNNFLVDASENAANFSDSNLRKYKAVVFLNTTGDVLNDIQRAAFQRYIRSGGGFVGIHGASGSETSWPWFGQLLGARFDSHPENQKGLIQVNDTSNIITKGLPRSWEMIEEWHNFNFLSDSIRVLASVNESSYKGGKHGENHPIAWYQNFEGGRSFFTALGHLSEAYTDSEFQLLILNGLKYSMNTGKGNLVSVNKVIPPPQYKFSKIRLAGPEAVQEPMELSIAKDGRIVFIERRGNVRVYDPESRITKIIGTIPVYSEHEDGLLGLALDPDFERNNWIYVFYSAPSNQFNYHLSRFTIKNNVASLSNEAGARYASTKVDKLNAESEIIMLKIHQEHAYSNHTGGSLAFDIDGNLFISVGDNAIPEEYINGYAPIDERDGKVEFDAQRSSANSNDLRGKILRIHPENDGTYTIPDGNLFPKDGKSGRPEIFVMGTRNPFRISVDKVTSWLYWGEVGPDARRDSIQGPRGYDEINQAKRPGNFGWPYFVADNKPYAKVDFRTGSVGPLFDVNGPVNNSPNNTGSKLLPSAQKAFIWYPYAKSMEFPLVGSGGRVAMAGPVYHYNPLLKSSVKLPEYYDKALFIYDWVRNWIMVVRMDEQGNYKSMEPFMTDTVFDAIVDMELGADGALYILEYGFGWHQANPEAKLSRLEFNEKALSPGKGGKPQTPSTAKQTDRSTGSSSSLVASKTGKSLIAKSDCRACHLPNQSSVGPSFVSIANRYKKTESEINKLASKVINGGSGVWGTHAMSAHPELSKKDAVEMVKYILSLSK